MAKTKAFETTDSTERDLGTYCWIYCPGCEGYHSLRVRMPSFPTAEEIKDQQENKHGLWTWNGDTEKPTFRASLLLPTVVCHSFITDGKIQFLNDCSHKLAGQTVDLPDIDI